MQRAGVGNLEAMHRSLRGYANGGLVAPTVPRISAPSGGGGRSEVIVLVETNDPMFQARVKQISGDVSAKVTRRGLDAYDAGKRRQQLTNG